MKKLIAMAALLAATFNASATSEESEPMLVMIGMAKIAGACEVALAAMEQRELGNYTDRDAAKVVALVQLVNGIDSFDELKELCQQAQKSTEYFVDVAQQK